eukprot:PRCOL_00002681-RA
MVAAGRGEGGAGGAAAAAARAGLAELYAAAAPLVPAPQARKGGARDPDAPLPLIHVDGFDAEQVWMQLERQTAPVLRAVKKRFSRAAAAVERGGAEAMLRAPATTSNSASKRRRNKQASRQVGRAEKGAAAFDDSNGDVSDEEDGGEGDGEPGGGDSAGDEGDEGEGLELKPSKKRHAMETDDFFHPRWRYPKQTWQRQ